MRVKLLIIFFALLTIFLLTSCGDDEESEKAQKDIQEVHKIAEDSACRQCEAMSCESCKSAPICRGTCGGCDNQCTIENRIPDSG